VFSGQSPSAKATKQRKTSTEDFESDFHDVEGSSEGLFVSSLPVVVARLVENVDVGLRSSESARGLRDEEDGDEPVKSTKRHKYDKNGEGELERVKQATRKPTRRSEARRRDEEYEEDVGRAESQ
jgi:hypothetical protein